MEKGREERDEKFLNGFKNVGWAMEATQRLIELVREHKKNWTVIYEKLGTGHSLHTIKKRASYIRERMRGGYMPKDKAFDKVFGIKEKFANFEYIYEDIIIDSTATGFIYPDAEEGSLACYRDFITCVKKHGIDYPKISKILNTSIVACYINAKKLAYKMETGIIPLDTVLYDILSTSKF